MNGILEQLVAALERGARLVQAINPDSRGPSFPTIGRAVDELAGFARKYGLHGLLVGSGKGLIVLSEEVGKGNGLAIGFGL